MERELVSVILVTWNSAQYLRRCLEALRQQTHRRVELIAIDNASSDESVSVLEGFLGSSGYLGVPRSTSEYLGVFSLPSEELRATP